MVQAHPGQDVVLSCRVETPSDLTAETLDWTNGTNVVHVFWSLGDDPDNQDPRFKGRTILNHQNMKDGNVSLTLTNVTKKDEGNYTCCLRTQKAHTTIQVRKTPFSDTSCFFFETEACRI
uniref:Ig-like domain-containing protein n=1 Tax=Oryzias sinensis TaxID=183150 RepID=A0A8C7X0U1_9TELE